MTPKRTHWALEAGDEWIARDPFGRVKPADVSVGKCPIVDQTGRVVLRAARGGYASCRLWAAGAGGYRITIDLPGAVEADLYRAWYHRMAPAAGAPEDAPPAWHTDALAPAAPGSPQRLPDEDNAIPGQTHQEYWLDVFVPADAAPGRVSGRVVLSADDGTRVELPLAVEVAHAVVPDDDAVICDHNSYGCSWLAGMYGRAFAACRDADDRGRTCIAILHHYHRLCREHRGLFSNLGAGHAGTFDRIYGPTTRGSGREKSLDDWTWYDRHYGPLLDGSAFATPAAGAPRPRRPAEPVWGVYTPISATWPADYLWWGQSGYEVEFTRCVGQFDAHFRRNGWLTSRPQFFFNHKKRYRWLEWDGDEPKHGKDDRHFVEMGRLLHQAVGDSPVPWVYRMDASWRMKDHFERFAGMVDFWVCGGFARWYPHEIARVVARGDVLWTYGGTPGIAQTSAALLEPILTARARGVGGYCRWLATAPGDDPFFACRGAETGLLYPGDRFGIDGPLASIRLKLQRNALQDVALLDVPTAGRLAERAGIRLWQPPPPAARDLPPDQWDSRNLAGGQDEAMADHAGLDPLWWLPVRQAALHAEGAP